MMSPDQALPFDLTAKHWFHWHYMCRLIATTHNSRSSRLRIHTTRIVCLKSQLSVRQRNFPLETMSDWHIFIKLIYYYNSLSIFCIKSKRFLISNIQWLTSQFHIEKFPAHTKIHPAKKKIKQNLNVMMKATFHNITHCAIFALNKGNNNNDNNNNKFIIITSFTWRNFEVNRWPHWRNRNRLAQNVSFYCEKKNKTGNNFFMYMRCVCWPFEFSNGQQWRWWPVVFRYITFYVHEKRKCPTKRKKKKLVNSDGIVFLIGHGVFMGNSH